MNRPYKKWIQKKLSMVSCTTTLIIFVFVPRSWFQVLKAAAFKSFSVLPCWCPILLKLQNSIAGVFQCVFKGISEHVFYRTTMNRYFRTKTGRCNYYFVSVRNYFRKDQSSSYKVLSGIIFGGCAFLLVEAIPSIRSNCFY